MEAEIQAVTQGQAPVASSLPAATPAATSPKLADALVEAREANRPLTARELGEELTRRRFPTTSGKITNLVQNRLTDLVKRGVFPAPRASRASSSPASRKYEVPRVRGGQRRPAAPAKKACAASPTRLAWGPAAAPGRTD